MNQQKESPDRRTVEATNKDEVMMGENNSEVKKKDVPVYVPTFEGFILLATKLHGHNSHIFEIHRMMTNPISDSVQLLDLHCIVDGIVMEFKAKDGRKYRNTLEVLDEN